ncbi:DNA-directed RNA polymerase I subunit RPA12 [Malania oleifera]|uniref:DNA-directed RNA polymerase I subunit RPA12 n=1 Tax=Malania oleifera TaxID=397392 RepID=UPI0025AE46A1|nr:DNA-directed RNA polymerase I subunit RPA12 [Malania oleifera]
MAYCRRRDFLFCKFCGTMLSFPSTKHAICPLCKSKQSLKEIAGKETCYTATAEDIRRELNIEPLIKLDGIKFDEVKVKKSTTNQACPNCNYTKAEYEARQMRSADEGQTITYTCLKCNHRWRENT